MMKFLKSQWPTLLAIFGGAVMLILRQVHLGTINERGLLASGHFAGIISSILALIVPAVLLWRSLVLPKAQNCKFPASIPGAVGFFIAAVGVGTVSVQFLLGQPDNFLLTLAFVGIVAAVALLMIGTHRFQGVKSNVLLSAVVCLFFMLLLVWQYRESVMNTQLQLCIYQPVATICLMIAAYNRAAFDEKMGHLRPFMFFRLVSIFFCLAAIPGTELWILYLAGAIWSAADLANLTTAPAEGG